MKIKELQKQVLLFKKTDKNKSRILSLLLDKAQKIAKESKREPLDEDIVSGAKRALKEAQQSQDAGMDVTEEMGVYKEFLPQSVDQNLVNRYISANFSKENKMGEIMQAVKANFGKNVDMKATSEYVKTL